MARGKRIQQVILADKHQLFRRGLRTLLSSESDFEVLDEVTALDDAVHKAQGGADVVVMDVSLLEGASEAQLLRLRQLQTSVPVLFLAPCNRPDCLQAAISAGGRGYMLKTSGSSELLAGIRRVAWGEDLDSASSSDSTADLKALAESGQKYARGAVLTSREQEILRLLAEGRTVRETALELALSTKTIEAHKLNLMRKLNIHNRATLVEYATEKGFIRAAIPA